MRFTLFFAVVGMAFTFTEGQSQSSDSQALESLAKEVRQLRQDLVTTTVAAQGGDCALPIAGPSKPPSGLLLNDAT
jgi:hypothetical protein